MAFGRNINTFSFVSKSVKIDEWGDVLLICGLFNDAVSISDFITITLNDMINEQRIGKDMEGNDCG
jgi:hypothetical protein